MKLWVENKFRISGDYAMGALGSRMCKSYIWMQFNKHIFRGDDVKASFLLKRHIQRGLFWSKRKIFSSSSLARTLCTLGHISHMWATYTYYVYYVYYVLHSYMTSKNDDKLIITIVPIHDTGPIFPEPKPWLGTTKIKHQPMIN